jgi:hypothetical protein
VFGLEEGPLPDDGVRVTDPVVEAGEPAESLDRLVERAVVDERPEERPVEELPGTRSAGARSEPPSGGAFGADLRRTEPAHA